VGFGVHWWWRYSHLSVPPYLQAQMQPLAIYSHSCQAQKHMLLCYEAPGAKMELPSHQRECGECECYRE
jgi:hypothetical protein